MPTPLELAAVFVAASAARVALGSATHASMLATAGITVIIYWTIHLPKAPKS
jgi:hypothetical protein